jgi:hypothetical protein
MKGTETNVVIVMKITIEEEEKEREVGDGYVSYL